MISRADVRGTQLTGDPSASIAAETAASSDMPFVGGREADFGPFKSISMMIEEQVAKRPEYPAISYDGRTLTYRQFDGLVNGLAAVLASRGVGRGDVVPVLLANSLELPVAYLALMKLGAAFVPLDPGWPAQRVRVTLDVLPTRIVLCGVKSTVEEYGPGTFVVDVDQITPASTRPAITFRPGDLVYGVFTSGTTGTPKCAMNRHGGLTNRFRCMSRHFGATGDEVVLQNSNHTFDSSIWQLFWPLTVGGHAVVPVQNEFFNLSRTIDIIAEYQVTATDFVSSIFNALVALVDGDEPALRKLSSLRWLVVGGEPVNPRAVHRLTARLPDLRVTNGYGPTETSIGMAFHAMSPADGDSVPLGRPLWNCYAAIVDDNLKLLSPGATGEIAVGGACLGEGYFGAPAATARAFVPNPFPELIPGERLYLTGDLGHLDDDGRLFFSSRKDFQVKIGGVRIELGEIESMAESCPGVRQAAVLFAERVGQKYMALFVSGDAELTEAALREHLRRSLPRTSRPAYYFLLSAMPLNATGKVDRKSLQVMLDQRVADDAARLADSAAGPTLADRVLWALRSALGQPGLAPNEHFMDAGGDSLTALTVVETIRTEYGVQQLCVQDLFDHPTAERMALVVETYRDDDTILEPDPVLMRRDAALAADEPIWPADPSQPVRAVLVTGATGFVGSRLVHELLSQTDLQVHCLARAGDDARATDRVVGALAGRRLWESAFSDRVHAYAADLSLPRLGLSASTWDYLARTCDLVLHGAALVNFLFDYRAHRRANVLGTAEVLRLATAHRPVPLHYVSTLAAMQSATSGRDDALSEHFEPSQAGAPPGGYNRSKWVAECYLAEARRRGAVITVLRLGEVMPSSDNGQPNPVALTHLLLSAFYRLRVRPDVDIRSDYTPVDYAAARIVAAVGDLAVWGETLHIFHPESVSFGNVLPRVGTSIARTSCGDFLTRVRNTASRTGDRELTALAALLRGSAEMDESGQQRMFESLLTDNPALYAKNECRRAEQRWQLTDGTLHDPIAAYNSYLVRRYRTDPSMQELAVS
jgi:amino acid adenylation domain-containing protein/thioester reductase-like protein